DRGVPDIHGRGRGDVIVQVQVEVPTRLTKNEEELLRRLAAERGEAVAAADDSLIGKIRSAFK
ncbi:MAG: molecular chaperone DnaJ, partial [Acidimicrobiia bacterium]